MPVDLDWVKLSSMYPTIDVEDWACERLVELREQGDMDAHVELEWKPGSGAWTAVVVRGNGYREYFPHYLRVGTRSEFCGKGTIPFEEFMSKKKGRDDQ
jgi:hypothetical protein